MADTDTPPDTHTRPGTAGNGQHNGASGHSGGPLAKLMHGDKKQLVMMLAAVVGVVIAWVTYRRMAGGSASSYSPTAGTLGGTTVADPDTGTDTTGADALSGLESRIANQNTLLRNLNNRLAHPASTGKPAGNTVPHFIYDRGHKLRYLRDRATGAIYQIMPSGKKFRLNVFQYAELGKPKVIDYGRAPKPPAKKGAHPPERHPKPPAHKTKPPVHHTAAR